MQNVDYEALRAGVDRRITARTNIRNSIFFTINLLLYIIVIIISGTVNSNSPGAREPALDVTETALIYAWIGWGVCLFFYGMNILINNPHRMQRMRRQLAEQELGKLAVEAMDSEARLEKPKRQASQEMEVYEIESSDDGELISHEDLDAPRKRHSSR